jgi:hypothetical protein
MPVNLALVNMNDLHTDIALQTSQRMQLANSVRHPHGQGGFKLGSLSSPFRHSGRPHKQTPISSGAHPTLSPKLIVAPRALILA